jgi:hypothetical protein
MYIPMVAYNVCAWEAMNAKYYASSDIGTCYFPDFLKY